MRTIFIYLFFVASLGAAFLHLRSTSVRPNGWYYVIDMEHDSLSADRL